MDLADILLIGAGLSMDAAAVSMTNGMVYKNLTGVRYAAMPAFFGAFQMLMPILGYYAGGLFADIMAKYSGILVFVILGIIGGKMIKEGFDDMKKHETAPSRVMDLKTLLFQAVATSIDAFAVGIGFSALGIGIIGPSAIIGATTAVIVVIAILIGRKFGDMLGRARGARRSDTCDHRYQGSSLIFIVKEKVIMWIRL